MTGMPDSLVVHIDRDLEEMIPFFFSFRFQDIDTINRCLKSGDLQEIKRIGHNLKGSGGGYGFDYITELGIEIEAAAVEGSIAAIEECAARLNRYLQLVEVKYV